MTIANPQAFFLLLILLPIAFVMWRRYVTGNADLRALTGLWRKVEISNVFVVKWFFTSLSFVLFVVFSVFALAEFHWGKEPVSSDAKEREIVLLLDISRSMLARDIAPSRLLRAAAVAKSLIERAEGASFGVVVFKGSGSLVIPVTEDTAALASFLDTLHSDLMSPSGTNIEAGLATAIESFSTNIEAGKTIVLFTDGGFLNGNPIKAAAEAAKQHIELIIVGTATNKSTPIPLSDGSYVTDENGTVVTTRLRDDVLREISRPGKANVHYIDNPGIVNELAQSLAHGGFAGAAGFSFRSQNKYRLFLMAGLFWLSLAIVLKSVKWKNVF